MLETDYIRLCQVTVLDKNEKCINRIQFAEDACTDTLTPKERLLSRKHEDNYDCNMCKGQHRFSEAKFAYQKDLFWDKKKNPDQPMTWFESRGEDEFKIVAVQENNGHLLVDRNTDGITIKDYVPGETHECTSKEGNRCDICFDEVSQ